MSEQEEKLFTSAKIPKEEVLTMIKEYRKHSKSPSAYVKDDHVKSVWFDVYKIKEMCEQIIDENGDGIRIYFGRYPASVKDFVNNKEIKPNRNTVILVSTAKEGNKHQDYFTKLAPHLKGKETEPENRGEQCQPHCAGTSDDGEGENTNG